MAIYYADFFDHQLPAGLASNPAAAQQIGGKFEINITGASWGFWFVDASASGPSCRKTDLQVSDRGADVVITMDVADFQHLIDDPRVNFMPLFFAGRVKATGDQRLMMKFPDLLLLAAK